MLVIGRRPKERVFLFLDGQKIAEIQILRVHGRTVRLGVTAARRVQIWREEVCPNDQKTDE